MMATNRRLAQHEQDGRRVAKFCARKPRTMREIREMLGDVSHGRAKRAIDWCKRQRLLTLNPFLCVHQGDYRYGFRTDLMNVDTFLLHELRYLGSRLANDEAVIEHCLVCTAELQKSVGPAERVMLNRWRKVMVGQAAAAEAISTELEELLAV